MKDQGLSREYWEQYANLMLAYLLGPQRRASGVSLIGVKLIAQWEQRLQSMKRAAGTFRQYLATKLLGSSRRRLPSAQLFDFYHEASNAFLAVYSDSEALEVLNLALSDLVGAGFNSESAKRAAKAKILNRKLATLKNFGRAKEALAAGRKALSSLGANDFPGLAVETLFDMGAVLLRLPGRRVEGWDLLAEGCAKFKDLRSEMVEPTPCRYFYVRGQQALGKHDFPRVLQACGEGILHCKRVLNHFWGIRILMLELVARLIQCPRSAREQEIVSRLLAETSDWMNVSDAERLRWGVQYLDGKYRVLMGKQEEAAESFASAILDLGTKLQTPEQLSWRVPVIHDIAATCRRNGLKLSRHVVGSLQSAPLRSEIELIIAMEPTLFRQFEANRLKNALFAFGDEIVELP